MRVFDSRKLLIVGVLLVITTLAVNGAVSKEAAVVKDVSIHSTNGSLEVRIATSERPQYTYFELSKPHRLVVDFHGLQNGVGFKEKSIDTAGVARVRTSFFTDKTRQATRIVFDLLDDVAYKVGDDEDGNVRVLFGAGTSATDSLKPPLQALGPVTLTAGPPIVSTDVPEPEAKPLPAVNAIEAPQAPAPQAVPLPPTLAQTLIPQQYNGEIVSFDVKDMDLKDFFRLIQSISGLNVIVDPAVSGTVTMTLTDVPWDQALDVVMKNNQLASQLQGNILRIAKKDTLQAEETSRKALKDAQELLVDLDTHTYILNYTKADVVAATLTRMLSPRGTILQDLRRNALIVSDVPNQFSRIGQLVQFLDTPAQQVEIEARILSANKSFSRELGNQLGFVLGNKSQNAISGVGQVGTSPFSRSPAPGVNTGGSSIPLSVNLPAAGTSGLSILLGSGADIILDEIITAAEARGTAKLISRPKVMTQNNVPANISSGTQIPVQTNQNNTVSVQFLKFSLQLTVTPQITDVGTIVLNVVIENSAPDFAKAVNGVPSVATQQATTTLLIQDGGTTVIGGILVDTDSYNLRQVPGLGSVPLIGHLFKNTQVIKSTAELLFFITARIMPADALNIQNAPPKGPGQQ